MKMKFQLEAVFGGNCDMIDDGDNNENEASNAVSS